MVTLTLGTKEYVPIKVINVLGNLASLDSTGLTHDLYKADEAETLVYANEATTNDGMIALPLIDTTNVGFEEGDYNIFIKFNALPEIPRLGPFPIRVDD